MVSLMLAFCLSRPGSDCWKSSFRAERGLLLLLRDMDAQRCYYKQIPVRQYHLRRSRRAPSTLDQSVIESSGLRDKVRTPVNYVGSLTLDHRRTLHQET